jgi:hypothetical protein
MDNNFKVFEKEDVLGKERNIYVKINKKVGAQSKTKYIKCKGRFIKLSMYIKEHAKDGTIVKISRKVSVINNVSKINDKKIRNLLVKTYDKNAKIYFISDNKRWHGGAPTGNFHQDVHRNNDLTVDRRDHGDEIDKLALELHYKEDVFDTICNMVYSFGPKGDNIYIRPYIKFDEHNKMFIKFYWSHHSWHDPSSSLPREWHEIPLHVSHFTTIMAGNRSGHIHITSEMTELSKYNIECSRRLTKNGENKTHTYLNAEKLDDLIFIMSHHGEEIFNDWRYVDSGSNTKFAKYFVGINGNWVRKTKRKGNEDKLTESNKKNLCYCINRLNFLLSDIFSTIQNGGLDEDDYYIKLDGGKIIRDYIDESDYRYINYIKSRSHIDWNSPAGPRYKDGTGTGTKTRFGWG